MDRAVYLRMAENEAEHWWFVGRRAVIGRLIGRILAGRDRPRLLEIGCGSGGNLGLLARFGRLDAVEYDPDARAIASARSGFPVMAGGLPHDLPAAGDGAYDLVALLDVLEHIEEDVPSLRAIGAKLAPDGRLLVTVPAMPWLWSSHDETHHHFRRYTRGSLAAAVRAAGLEVEETGYFNSLLFPVAVVRRLMKALTGSDAADDALPPPALNAALKALFSAERHLVGRLPMPVGLSAYAIVRRPAAAGA